MPSVTIVIGIIDVVAIIGRYIGPALFADRHIRATINVRVVKHKLPIEALVRRAPQRTFLKGSRIEIAVGSHRQDIARRADRLPDVVLCLHKVEAAETKDKD